MLYNLKMIEKNNFGAEALIIYTKYSICVGGTVIRRQILITRTCVKNHIVKKPKHRSLWSEPNEVEEFKL